MVKRSERRKETKGERVEEGDKTGGRKWRRGGEREKEERRDKREGEKKMI